METIHGPSTTACKMGCLHLGRDEFPKLLQSSLRVYFYSQRKDTYVALIGEDAAQRRLSICKALSDLEVISNKKSHLNANRKRDLQYKKNAHEKKSRGTPHPPQIASMRTFSKTKKNGVTIRKLSARSPLLLPPALASRQTQQPLRTHKASHQGTAVRNVTKKFKNKNK